MHNWLRVLADDEMLNVDYVAVPTGPRVSPTTRSRRYNACLSRFQMGLNIQREFRVPLLISGHDRETKLVEKEIEYIRNKYDLPATQVLTCSKAQHTAGNAVYILRAARREFGFTPLTSRKQTQVIGICTHTWHIPRMELLIRGVQDILVRRNLYWARSKPFEFKFIGVSSSDLDPSFWRPIARAERRKRVADAERIERWMRLSLYDAPTGLAMKVSDIDEYIGFDYEASTEHDMAAALAITERDAPNPFQQQRAERRQVAVSR